MLFLGAGASAAVGLPTLHELTQKIRGQYSDIDNRFEEIDKIERRSQSNTGYHEEELDLEVYFTILDSLVEPAKSIYDFGPFAVYLYKSLLNKQAITGARITRKEIQNLKKKSLKIIAMRLKKPDLNKTKELYDELFRIDEDSTEALAATGMKTYNIFEYVATTNYDLVLESYANLNKKRSYYLTQRGFDTMDGGYSLNLPRLRQASNQVNYLKLHGSLDWWKREDGPIVTSLSGEQTYGMNLVENIMIYPIYEKYISLDPFYSLYTALRNMLWNQELLVVIGYSFRDVSINNAFVDYLKMKDASRIIISVKSEEVRQRIVKVFGNDLVFVTVKLAKDD